MASAYGPSLGSSAGGQQDRAQMMTYEGNSSSSTSAIFPLDPAVNQIGETIALRMRDEVSTLDPQDPALGGTTRGEGGEHYAVLFLENDSPCFSIFLVW